MTVCVCMCVCVCEYEYVYVCVCVCVCECVLYMVRHSHGMMNVFQGYALLYTTYTSTHYAKNTPYFAYSHT